MSKVDKKTLTLKEITKKLKDNYKYVRLMETYNKMNWDNLRIYDLNKKMLNLTNSF